MTTRHAALVTGAARRIGRAIVERLVADGRAVALHASRRSHDEAQSLARALAQNGARVAVVAGDLAEPQTPAALLAQARQALGPIDLLVNNASIFEPDRPDAIDAEGWDRHFAVNLRAPVLLASRFAALATSDGLADACIVNIVDQRVLRLTPHYFTYTLTKSALWTATQTMAQAFAPHLRVNAVAPGPVLPNQTEGDEGFLREAANVPLARAIEPQEVADAVAWLAQARGVTGQMICVDAGQHIAWKTPDAPP